MIGSVRAFNEAYRGRVRALREGRGWTQEEMAEAIGVPLHSYKKYETRSPLPPHLIGRFAALVGRDIAYVLTGKSEGGRRGPRGVPKKQTAEDQPDAEG